MTYGWEIRRDYSSDLNWGSGRRKRRRRRLAAALALGVLASAVTAVLVVWSDSPTRSEPVAESATIALELPASKVPVVDPPPASTGYPFEPDVVPTADAAAPPEPGEWKEVVVQAGDNMSLIFSRLELPASQLHAILQADEESERLKRLRPGQQLRVRIDDGTALALEFEEDLFTTLSIRRIGESYDVAVRHVEPERQVTSRVGQIESSLFISGQTAGLSDGLIMQLVEVFGWDIDFVLEVRSGDRFSVIFEEYLKDGVKVRDGSILAAEFTNRDRVLRAVRYTNHDGSTGYYSDEGAAMKKAFLRTPVKFSRISSRFNLKRKHPVLNRIRAHRGVDYAAPHGTPVKATGDGSIKFAARKGGYGNVVEIQHGGVYSTLYAHLSRFARGVRAGSRVRQGQIIGYVGKTGLATGPHLHYEFRINGVHRNPLTVPLPKAEPLPPQYLPDFHAKAAPLLAELDRLAKAPPLTESVAISD